MNKLSKLCVVSALVGFALFNTGCASAGRAVQGAAVPILGGAGGALLGYEMTGTSGGAAIGAATGIALAATLQDIHRSKQRTEILEAYEQGKREARLEAGREFWDEMVAANGDFVRNSTQLAQDKNRSRVRQVQYEPHIVEGVRYGASYNIPPEQANTSP